MTTSECRSDHRHFGRCLPWRCGCSCGRDLSDPPEDKDKDYDDE